MGKCVCAGVLVHVCVAASRAPEKGWEEREVGQA